MQPAVKLLFERARLVAIMLAMAFALAVVNWAWPNAIRQALAPLKVLIRTLGL
jgi:hypothetical protein